MNDGDLTTVAVFVPVIFMEEDVQQKLGMLHETWAWLCSQYTLQAEQLEALHGQHREDARTIVSLRQRFVEAPWYKRIWRALTAGST